MITSIPLTLVWRIQKEVPSCIISIYHFCLGLIPRDLQNYFIAVFIFVQVLMKFILSVLAKSIILVNLFLTVENHFALNLSFF